MSNEIPCLRFDFADAERGVASLAARLMARHYDHAIAHFMPSIDNDGHNANVVVPLHSFTSDITGSLIVEIQSSIPGFISRARERIREDETARPRSPYF